MTSKQMGYIKFLSKTRAMPSDVRDRLEDKVQNGMDNVQASRTIDWLLRQPTFDQIHQPELIPSKPAPTQEAMPDVHEGRYAIDHEGTVKFYRVDRPTDGKWAGRVFVSVQASDDFHSIRSWESRVEILKVIAADPKEAMLRYGKLIGKCGHCGRTLTNEESRKYGIGPICREGIGW